MRPFKTDKAREALRERPVDVDSFERRVLILSDGQRDDKVLVSLLGAAVEQALRRMLQEGYLTDLDADKRVVTIVTSAPVVSFDKVSADSAIPQMPSAPELATTSSSSRRSLVAAKMYVLDMLQLQKGRDVAAVTNALRTRGDQDEVVAAILSALAFVRETTTDSYSRRVAERLGEVLPEEYLSQYEIYRETLFVMRSVNT